jgi:hypothetical protein
MAEEFDLDRFRRQAIVVHEFLNQDTHWVDVHGRVLTIADMSVGYKANCLAFVRARIRYYATRYPWGAIWSMELPSGLAELGRMDEHSQPTAGRSLSRGEVWLDNGGNMSDAFDQHIEDLDRRIKADPEAWLDSTPLMKALSDQVLAGEGGAVGSRPEDEPRPCPAATPCPKCDKPADISMHRRSGGITRLCTGEWVRLV